MRKIEKCNNCGNADQFRFFITVFGSATGYSSSFVECACGCKGHKRQGHSHVEARDSAISAWNNNGQFVPRKHNYLKPWRDSAIDAAEDLKQNAWQSIFYY